MLKKGYTDFVLTCGAGNFVVHLVTDFRLSYLLLLCNKYVIEYPANRK